MPLVGQGIGINVSRQATDRANGSCALVSTAPRSCDCAKMAEARYNVITIDGSARYRLPLEEEAFMDTHSTRPPSGFC